MGDTVALLWTARRARAAAWLQRPAPKGGRCWASGYWLRTPRPALRLHRMRRRGTR